MERDGKPRGILDHFAESRLGHKIVNSEPVYGAIEFGMTKVFIEPLKNPTNENVLKVANRLSRLANLLITDPKDRILESRVLGRIKREFEEAIRTGQDTNLTLKTKRALSLMNEEVLNTLFVKFGFGLVGRNKLNQHFQGEPHIEQFGMEILSECNMNPRCDGCFANEANGRLDYDTQDKLMKESMDLRSRFTVIFGGETLIDKANLLKLIQKYARMPFIIATNGILLDEEYAKKVSDSGNVLTLIDIHGSESTTNKKNPRMWDHITEAVTKLNKYRAPVGFATHVTQNNYIEVSSPEFAQQMKDFGMMIGFYFAHTDPIGCSPQTELALTPQMEDVFSERAKSLSDNSQLILVDTSHEAEKKIGGCPAGKASIIYVQSDGNVGGCPMAPQRDNSLNVHSASLRDILSSDYFNLIRNEKPSCLRGPIFQEKLAQLNKK